jgi:hypothetical protein
MISGFNNNVMIKGQVFHIQTEAGGVKNPVISTIVFKGGEVVLSKKTNYSDIIKFENLGAALREIMKEQHIATLKALRDEIMSSAQEDSESANRKVDDNEFDPSSLNDKAIDDIIRSYLRADKASGKGDK